MNKSRTLIVWEFQRPPDEQSESVTMAFTELDKLFRSWKIFKHIFRYRKSVLYTYRYEILNGPFQKALAFWLLSRGPSYIKDQQGTTCRISVSLLLKLFIKYIRDLFMKPYFRFLARKEVTVLLNNIKPNSPPPRLDLSASPVYLRTDDCFTLIAGGSVAHTSGVVNNLSHFTGAPVFIAPSILPGINDDIEKHEVSPHFHKTGRREILFLNYNEALFKESINLLNKRPIAFIYQRYSLHNYSGLRLARHYQAPFVLEYNGSEIWVGKNWGTPFKNQDLWESIETLNLKAADLIVVVSKPIKDQLIARGINEKKILVNPNGVDPEIYNPNIDGSPVRNKLGLNNKIVFGFIGTFGKWHGAETLADSFAKLLKRRPEFRNKVRLLMIGAGLTFPLVSEILNHNGVKDETLLVGMVPQEEGPQYLAACDYLVSPHVPNSDGTPFFGSPTKLFEYMAMGKGIIASDLDQIGEILTHEKNALMVKPGDPDSLMKAMIRLIQSPELGRKLGQSAREEAVKNYTWKEHTRKIIHKLKERCQHP